MKILFYSHFYYPEVGAASVRIQYFVNALRNAGHEVLVVTPKPSYPIGKIYDGYEKKWIIKNRKENIVYLPIFFTGSHSAFGRLFSYISYFFFSLIYLLKKNYNPEIVISSSPPIFTSLASLIYSKIKKSNLIFDIRDIWPDIGVELGIIKSKFFIWGLKKIEHFLLKNSSSIIVTAKGDKKNIEAKIGSTGRIEVIYNGADTNIFRPLSSEEKTKIRNQYSLPIDKKIIVYFGSYNYGMNDIEILGEFLSDERFVSKNIHFLSIGSGDNLNTLIEKIEKKISYTIIKSLPSVKIAELVGVSDISIIPRKAIKKDTGGNIPVKCFESWAAGIPVLFSNIDKSEISDIFDKCGAGVRVKPSNVDELINGLEKLLSSDLRRLGNIGRKFVEENFDRKKEAEKIVRIVKCFENRNVTKH